MACELALTYHLVLHYFKRLERHCKQRLSRFLKLDAALIEVTCSNNDNFLRSGLHAPDRIRTPILCFPGRMQTQRPTSGYHGGRQQWKRRLLRRIKQC